MGSTPPPPGLFADQSLSLYTDRLTQAAHCSSLSLLEKTICILKKKKKNNRNNLFEILKKNDKGEVDNTIKE